MECNAMSCESCNSKTKKDNVDQSRKWMQVTFESLVSRQQNIAIWLLRCSVLAEKNLGWISAALSGRPRSAPKREGNWARTHFPKQRLVIKPKKNHLFKMWRRLVLTFCYCTLWRSCFPGCEVQGHVIWCQVDLQKQCDTKGRST